MSRLVIAAPCHLITLLVHHSARGTLCALSFLSETRIIRAKQGSPMRILLATVLLGLAAPVLAQSPGDRGLPSQSSTPVQPRKAAAAAPDSKLPTLQAIPEPPPPPPGLEPDPALEPQVTIQRRGTDTVEEFRLNGRLYMIKVTPPNGRPYYLVDYIGRGEFSRLDSYDTGTRPPMWVIHQW
jgi:hypothetical protein